jgi:hypothetical protein
LENSFNARTWYGGTPNWPEIGEVEDAPRLYSKGGNPFTGGVKGTADQWLSGAFESDAVAINPCIQEGPICLAYPTYGGEIQDSEGVTQPIIAWSPTRSYAIDSGAPVFWTVDLVPGNCCQFGTKGFWTLTDGPPDFNPIDPLPDQFVLDGTSCHQGDVFAFYIDEILGMGWTLFDRP